MQKKLLTLAVAGALAAPAAALAQVEVYGTIHMSVNKMKYDEGTPVAGVGTGSKSAWDVASHASNVGVRARESLGGGLSAWAQVETNASMERSNNVAHTSNFASRNSAVGLQGGWGNAFVGQWTTPWADLDALWAIGTVATYGPVTSIIGRRETTGSSPNPNCATRRKRWRHCVRFGRRGRGRRAPDLASDLQLDSLSIASVRRRPSQDRLPDQPGQGGDRRTPGR